MPKLVLSEEPEFLQDGSYAAAADRRLLQETIAPGVFERLHWAPSWVSGLTVRAAPGTAFIPGRNQANQGYYRLTKATNSDLAVATADATNPRLDNLIIRIMDASHDTSTLYEARVETIAGTPSAGATLDNRTGAPNLDALAENSKNTLLLADILVPAGAAALSSGAVRDRRPFAAPCIPNALGDSLNDVVPFQTLFGLGHGSISGTGDDLKQAVSCVWLPRRMEAALGVQWAYRQGATAITGNYIFSIYDASGRQIIATTSQAFSGATTTFQRPNAAFSASASFEAGVYYIMFGVDGTNAGTADFTSYCGDVNEYLGFINPNINQHGQRGTGGVTAPVYIGGAILANNTAGGGLAVPFCNLYK